MAEQDGTPSEALDAWFSTARTAARDDAVTVSADSYREFLFAPEDPVLADWRGLDYAEFSRRKREPDFVQELLADWRALYDEPFRGITEDGTVRTEVWARSADALAGSGGHGTSSTGGEGVRADAPADSGVDGASGGGEHGAGAGLVGAGTPEQARAAQAADALLALLDESQAEAVAYPLDAPEWRAWSNPEFVIHEVGLRLEELTDEQARAALRVVEAALSPEGYERVHEAMALNGYLGELTELPLLMNDKSYWFSLFGEPSATEPWGFQLFGHHVDLNVVFVGGRQVAAPVFIGAEPALTDGERPPLFDARERLGIALASSLTDEQRSQAVVYATVLDPAMPEGRLHPADERHVAGAFRDNRVVPFEGLPVAELDDAQRGVLLAIVEDFLLLLPDEQRDLALADVERFWDETHLAWYGATDGSQPFYLRIHGPAIIAELDHHAGVWLGNEVPQRFHVHTTLRLPHGNDYGKAFIAQWNEASGA
ncbi:DUF3500 domain-containing protein [Demequina sp. NBRC 110056]|uniref:DUF3500 domain-containing protein n=1 Tax=Demequina sp. NBRC 110056 TaxID=1570345 RepID=UPI000A05726C|nr:DUF3500 domain-containing protein [Demequina sp. NBRC 110056]